MRRAAALAPQNAYIYYDLGNLYASRKNYDEAVAAYNKAIELNANIAETYFNCGLVEMKRGRQQEAVKNLSKAGELGVYDAYSVIKQISKDKKQ